MGKLTAEQQQQLDELQALQAAADDDEVEIFVRDDQGRETRLTGSHAQRWIQNLFGDEPPAAKKTAAKKVTAAKKAAAPAKKAATAPPNGDEDLADADDDDEDLADDGPPAKRNWYFG